MGEITDLLLKTTDLQVHVLFCFIVKISSHQAWGSGFQTRIRVSEELCNRNFKKSYNDESGT